MPNKGIVAMLEKREDGIYLVIHNHSYAKISGYDKWGNRPLLSQLFNVFYDADIYTVVGQLTNKTQMISLKMDMDVVDDVVYNVENPVAISYKGYRFEVTPDIYTIMKSVGVQVNTKSAIYLLNNTGYQVLMKSCILGNSEIGYIKMNDEKYDMTSVITKANESLYFRFGSGRCYTYLYPFLTLKSKTIHIPERINGFNVTSISPYAFSGVTYDVDIIYAPYIETLFNSAFVDNFGKCNVKKIVFSEDHIKRIPADAIQEKTEVIFI